MDRKAVYQWIKSLNGQVTIGQIIEEFSDLDPIEIAEGFNMYLDRHS